MGMLWRLFAPKPLKKARRSVRKAAHPVRAVTPKPIRKARRTAFKVAHPVRATGQALEDQLVRSIQKKPARSSSADRAPSQSARIRTWARRNGYHVADKGRVPARIVAAYNEAHRK